MANHVYQAKEKTLSRFLHHKTPPPPEPDSGSGDGGGGKSGDGKKKNVADHGNVVLQP